MTEQQGGGRRRWATGAAALLLVSGAAVLGVAALAQESPAQPPLATGTDGPRPGSTERPEPSAVPAPSVTAAPSPEPTAASEVPAPPAPVPASEPAPEAVPAPQPSTLSIPSIGVTSDLLHLGLTDEGSVAVPPPGPTYDTAAWFTGSPTPGSVGPAVIEGHVDSAAGGPSVFYRLGELTPGDEITVGRKDGSSATFRVTGAERYPKDEFPTLRVYGNTAGPELRLITCGGPFDSGSGHYRDNTVVYAEVVVADA